LLGEQAAPKARQPPKIERTSHAEGFEERAGRSINEILSFEAIRSLSDFRHGSSNFGNRPITDRG
jgi:hypothetical protein